MKKKTEAPAQQSRSFSASLERLRSSLGWVIVRVPFDVTAAWNMGKRPKVKGEINGYPFRSSLFPTRDGMHFLLVNKRMQKGAQAGIGKAVQIRLEPDADERTVAIPAELKRALSGERALPRWFDKLNYSTRKWIADWVSDARTAETRARRSEQVAEQLLSTMEAERELPPMIQRAFSHNPQALSGWKRMSPTRRRGLLLAIFHYRTPESRARRLAKTLEEAEAIAEQRIDRKPGRKTSR
jgi:uncharacterized protein YdeI (YjbR/CyaY-like superfamily)